MGKIRIAQLGSEEEEKIRQERNVKREEKKKRVSAGKPEKVHLSGMKGGERIKTVGAQTEEEIEKLIAITREVEQDQSAGIKVAKEEDKKAKKKRKARVRGKKYQSSLLKLDHQKQYPIDAAIPLLRQISYASFAGSVEVHINTNDKGLRGNVSFPHGTGKKVRVVIADESTVDKIVEEVSHGKINFDVLVAHPKAVPKLAQVAKFLGPKGLMPNPKTGTISPEPEKVAKKLEAGSINWKTESDFPIIHQVIGKLTFKDKQLEENFQALVKSIGDTKIKNITLKSTMSPGIKVQVS